MINTIIHKHFELVKYIIYFLLIGILIGMILFSRVVGWLLNHYHGATIAALTGFMVGALPTVWPFWTYQYVLDPIKLSKGPQLQVVEPILPQLDTSLFWISCGCAVAGG